MMASIGDRGDRADDPDGGGGGERLRIAIASAFLPAWTVVRKWAEARGHRVVLTLTPPRSRQIGFGRPAQTLLSTALDGHDVLVTGRLRSTAPEALRGLTPDLLISAIFPRLIPPELTAVPGLGAVNLHPGPLPDSRGPTPQRRIYEGASSFGVTLHRTEAEFDNGAILSSRVRPVPADPTSKAILTGWSAMFVEALDEGVPRVAAGQWGEPQDGAGAGYAGAFDLPERILDWNEPATVLQRRAAVLNLFVPIAQVAVDGQLLLALEVRADAGDGVVRTPGTIVERSEDYLVAATGEGLAHVTTTGPAMPDWRRTLAGLTR